ncbi:GNAT family N-acetyltransferase [Catellatospora sichuanensis]|uniref:GNAT family N-acetyltransferase n=1 Tax=Catellatospora sichuanensis TaxID=1969805 RepID=UPI0011828C06|nr:GNAT family protein [Catellatospora sichuanensis]
MKNDHLWYALPVLTGRHVRLEPLAVEHAPGYLAAVGHDAADDEVFRWQSPPGGLARPVTLDDATGHITAALAARARGGRLPYAQIDVATGEFAGTTSFSDPEPGLRSLSIGYTWLGRRWWGTGLNVEAKLLMMAYAFETLAAVRIAFVTDILNLRAQAAIERLGAAREGVLRKHRRRGDGTWRDTVLYAVVDDDWPTVRSTLHNRLAAMTAQAGRSAVGLPQAGPTDAFRA